MVDLIGWLFGFLSTHPSGLLATLLFVFAVSVVGNLIPFFPTPYLYILLDSLCPLRRECVQTTRRPVLWRKCLCINCVSGTRTLHRISHYPRRLGEEITGTQG